MIELLYKALDAEIGVVVKCDDAYSLRQKLYKEMKSFGISNLSITIAKFDELYIYKRSANGKPHTKEDLD